MKLRSASLSGWVVAMALAGCGGPTSAPPDLTAQTPADGGAQPGRDGGMMPPGPDMPPPGPDGGMPTPKLCTTDNDCVGACPLGAKGCKCTTPPLGPKVCAPTCTVPADCPMLPLGQFMCVMNVCVPPL